MTDRAIRSLVLGPVLRHVDETTAAVWVQLDRAATVTVLGCTARTFEVSGHHFALVTVTGLEPDTTYPYEVAVDGEVVWPPPVTPYPPSSLRTRGRTSSRRLRIVFGSCRYVKVPPFTEPKLAAKLGIDALDAFAVEMTRRPRDEWPDALLLLGDQVYADELTPQNRRRIAGRRDREPDWPDHEIVDFDEYVGLYRDSWSDPEVRWLLSCVPTGMIFDDHDVRDDWNTSAVWREQMARKPWWRARIRSALASYWVYQHLGNLPSTELADDPDFREISAAEGDTWPLLAALADRADAEVDGSKGVRFSFRWDLGSTRFIMIDSRNGRILDGGDHLMLGEEEFGWVEQQVAERLGAGGSSPERSGPEGSGAAGSGTAVGVGAAESGPGTSGTGHPEATRPGTTGSALEHLVIGTSLPWLLPHALGDLQSIVSAEAARPGLRGRIGEALRQGGDLEHWQAFRPSFDRFTRMITAAATGPGAPASINVLSGDVHHSYAAQVDLPGPGDDPGRGAAAVHQLTCSPVHNAVDWFIRPGFRLGWSRTIARLVRRWADRVDVPPVEVSWHKLCGPVFGNTIATLELDGRHAEVVFAQPRSAGSLVEVARLELADGPRAGTEKEVRHHAGAQM